MRRSSASCNALSALGGKSVDTRVVPPKRQLLSVCESSPCLYHEGLLLEPTSLFLQNNEKLHLPSERLDEYLQSIPRVASRSEEVLKSETKDLLENDKVRCLNVLQGEIAHATRKEADVLCSAEATTCHIVALYSNSASPLQNTLPLASLTHVDKVGYDACLQRMVQEHIKHHNADSGDDNFGFFYDEESEEGTENFVPLTDVSSDEPTRNESPSTAEAVPLIEIEIHMLGGFLDDNGKSQELSTSLLLAFSKLAKRFEDTVKMKIVTAAISCMNSCAETFSPLGRGLGIDVRTGHVFTVNSVPSQLAGPALQVRSARIFRSDRHREEKLQVIHHSTSNGQLCIEPFDYEHFHQLDTLARLPDKTLLQLTSTSPNVEGEGFCESIRSTIGFIKRVPSCEVFGTRCDEPLLYRRTKSNTALNDWALCT